MFTARYELNIYVKFKLFLVFKGLMLLFRRVTSYCEELWLW